MEWVETTGRTLEEAKEAALDQLGVDEQDAEFEIVGEAKTGLFGRVRSEARVRARVRPETPRPKLDRRERGRKRGGQRAGAADGAARPVASAAGPSADESAATMERSPRPPRRERPAPDRSERPERAERPKADRPPRERRPEKTPKETPVEQPDDLAEVSASLQRFLEGLLDAFDAEGTVTVKVDEDEGVVEAAVDGADLGLLIGPKGQTIQAVQELARSAVVHGPGTRIRIDIGSYRQKRAEALDRFTRQVAGQVLESGEPVAMEPMGAADRKVVHDTANTIEGVTTSSQGEEPRRWVVISPE